MERILEAVFNYVSPCTDKMVMIEKYIFFFFVINAT